MVAMSPTTPTNIPLHGEQPLLDLREIVHGDLVGSQSHGEPDVLHDLHVEIPDRDAALVLRIPCDVVACDILRVDTLAVVGDGVPAEDIRHGVELAVHEVEVAPEDLRKDVVERKVRRVEFCEQAGLHVGRHERRVGVEDVPVPGGRLLDDGLRDCRILVGLDVDAHVEGLLERTVQFRIRDVVPADDVEILRRPSREREGRHRNGSDNGSGRPQGGTP